MVDFFYIKLAGEIPYLKNIWWLVIFLTLISGSVVTRWCGGARIGKRILAAAVCGAGIALFYTLISAFVWNYYSLGMDDLLVVCMWRLFFFTLFTTIGAILTEIRLPDPDLISGK